MTSLPDFRLFAYLNADLRRQWQMLHLEADGSPANWRLWFGALSPRFIPVLLCRLAHKMYLLRLGLLAKLISLINFFLFGIEIAIRCPIGPGLFFPHTQGTVVGAWAIGANATIFQGVTLGASELDFSYQKQSRPSIGDDVTIGSGAKVLGGIWIDAGACIGANSVVLSSIPANAVAVGAPAKVVRMRESARV